MVLKNIIIGFVTILSTNSYAQSVLNPNWPTGGVLTSKATATKGPMGAAQNSTYYNWTYTDSHGTVIFTATSWVYGVYPQGNYWGGTSSATQTLGPDSYGVYYTLKANGSTGNVSVSYSCSAYPKFQVLGVYYAPPGPLSTLSYAGSSMASNKTTFSKTYSNTIGISASAKLFGTGITLNQDWTQSSDVSNSLTTQSTRSNSYSVKNPASGAPNSNLTNQYMINPNFINHDNDIIVVWLNPQINLTQTGPSAITYETGYNPLSSNDVYASPVGGQPTTADVIALQVGWLNGHIPFPNDDIRRRCARTWDTSYAGDPDSDITSAGTPLTAEQLSRPRSLFYTLPDGSQPDLFAILSSDPWAMDASGSSAFTSTPGRYISVQKNVQFAPYSSITANTGISLTDQRTNEDSITKSSSQSFSVSTSYSLFGAITGSISDKWVWTSKSVQTTTTQSMQSSGISIFNPVSYDPKNNPLVVPYYTALNVYQDSYFGTFLFTYPDNSAIDYNAPNALATDWQNAPSGLTYSTPKATYGLGVAITPNTPTSSGKPITSYSVYPALPVGLTLNGTTGVISGTPTAFIRSGNDTKTTTGIFTVTGTNSGGNTTAQVTITIQ